MKNDTTNTNKSTPDEKKGKKIKLRTGKTQTISSVSSVSRASPETMEELLKMKGGLHMSVKKGDTVEGKIVSFSPKEIFVDIGSKSYGIVAEWELEQVKEYISQLTTGDIVTAQVVNPENDIGYVVLSLRKSSVEFRWSFLKEARESGKDLSVIPLETAKGGLLVDWNGLRGFVPSTQLEGNFASNPASLLGKPLTVKVLEIDRSVNRLVLSQRASALGVTPSFQKEKLEKIHSQDTLKGKVSGIAPFGVFVDIDGLEGLVHISEIAWEKVENPGNLYKTGDEVEVMVLDVNKEEGKLNLSIKRLTPDPWKNILDRYPLESTVTGQAVRSVNYGVFVQLEPGIEGLLHVSKITPGEEPKVGDTISCVIENIDTARRKISLTLIPKEKPVGYR